eukprot:3836805-Pleurochrysis_carterae.AAC.1
MAAIGQPHLMRYYDELFSALNQPIAQACRGEAVESGRSALLDATSLNDSAPKRSLSTRALPCDCRANHPRVWRDHSLVLIPAALAMKDTRTTVPIAASPPIHSNVVIRAFSGAALCGRSGQPHGLREPASHLHGAPQAALSPVCAESLHFSA